MKLTFLGTGTSTGVPTVGCSCPVCTSEDPLNRRMRSSILVETETTAIVVDTGPEFRLQALFAQIAKLDAVLYTHAHADHVLGIDDLRPLTYRSSLDVYSDRPTRERIEASFPYIFSNEETPNSKPKLSFRSLEPLVPVTIGDVEIVPLEIDHGPQKILGFRFGPVAYLTDCSGIPPSTAQALSDLDTLVVGALRYEPHPTHFNLDQALEASRSIGARATYLTHLSHRFDHRTLTCELAAREPAGAIVVPAHDGLTLTWDAVSKAGSPA